VEVQLADPARTVPPSRPGRRLRYEPKWDGWRAILFAGNGWLRSRRNNDLGRRFPEILTASAVLGDVVLDGELVALRDGRVDFGALATRPRDRAATAGITIYYVAFDLLAVAQTDWRPRPSKQRRAELERRFVGIQPPLQLTPATTDLDEALGWMRPEVTAVGIEGVVAKPVDAGYRAGRGGWIKIRTMAVVDAVVVGVTGDPSRPSEVVLARPDAHGRLERVGLSLPLSTGLGREIGEHVAATGETDQLLPRGPFGAGKTEYLPVRPELVVEIEAEASIVTGNSRLRPRVHRVRLDLAPDDLAED
jgi:ATP-dependent DNA ligase